MAAPSYTTDLVLITDADGGADDPGTWAELAGYTGGGGLTTPDTDYYIEGTGCSTLSTANKTGLQVGINYTHDTTFTINVGECAFIWHVLLAGNAMESFADGGLRLGLGDNNGDAYMYKVGGNDFGRNPYGGWQNYAINPRRPPDYTIGTPAAYNQTMCCLPNLAAGISKGNLLALDSFRIGRGTLWVSGGDLANGYANFEGMAAANDSQNNRWGLFQSQAGQYLFKGLMSFGVSGGNAVDFRDSNANIVVDVTPRTYRTFNRIEIHNSSSKVYWTGVNISSLPPSGYFAPGDLKVVDDADVRLDTCVFTDLGEFEFLSNSIIDGTTWRRCEQIYWGSAPFDRCVFDSTRASAAIYTEDLEDITNCSFIRTNNNLYKEHGIHMAASGSYSFTGNTFTNYGPSGSISAAIFHNSGGHLTINVVGGSVPTVYNAPNGSTSSVVASVNWYFQIVDTNANLVSGAEFRIFDAKYNGNQLYGVEISDGTELYSFDASIAGTTARVVVHSLGYIYNAQSLTHPSTSNTAGAPTVIVLQRDRNYNNP